MSFDLPRLHVVLLREVGCGGWTGWLTARAKHLEAQGGPPTGTSVASLMDEVWIPPPHDKGDSQTTPPPRLTGHLVMSSGHSWGSSEEGSSHTLHEPRMWSVLALCPWLSPLLPDWTTRRAIVYLSPPALPRETWTKESKGGAGRTDLGSWWQTEPKCLLWPARSGALGWKGHFTHTASVDCGRTRAQPWSEPTSRYSSQTGGIRSTDSELLPLALHPHRSDLKVWKLLACWEMVIRNSTA